MCIRDREWEELQKEEEVELAKFFFPQTSQLMRYSPTSSAATSWVYWVEVLAFFQILEVVEHLLEPEEHQMEAEEHQLEVEER